MTIKIAHSTIDENGRSSGGKLGDQTGREVCVRNWYSGGWHTVLRPKSETMAKESASAAVWIANSNLDGYDQSNRNSLHKALKAINYNFRNLKEKTESDCSAFVTACALCGGAKELEYEGNAPVTATMVDYFEKSGCYTALKESKYLTGYNYLRRGDILVKKGHTVIVVEDGPNAAPFGSVSPAPATGTVLPYKYVIGNTYTLQSELRVRTGPGLKYHALTHSELTDSGKSHDTDRDGALEAGTRVTVKQICGIYDGYLWVRIPSGYIAACKCDPVKIYVK